MAELKKKKRNNVCEKQDSHRKLCTPNKTEKLLSAVNH